MRRNKKSLRTHEIRVLRFDKKGIFGLIQEIFNEISFEKFQLPGDVNSNKHVCIDWYFDEGQCQVILFAYHSADRINKKMAIAYMKNLPGEALESLLINTRGKYYQTIKNNAFGADYANSGKINNRSGERDNVIKRLCVLWNRHIRPLRRHELRVIRLSEQAIHELIWEYFMRIGDEIMDIPEEDSPQKISYMHVEDGLEELKFYVLNLSEVSMVNFEEVNTYCKNNVELTTDLFFAERAGKQCYTSVMFSNSVFSTCN